jgi:hypothetical protein
MTWMLPGGMPAEVVLLHVDQALAKAIPLDEVKVIDAAPGQEQMDEDSGACEDILPNTG